MNIFSVLNIFIIFPFAAMLIGALYIRMYIKLKTLSSLIAGLAWLAYSLYEYMMYTRVLCSGECNIRLDLLLIYPILPILSIAATLLYYGQKSEIKEDKE